MPGQDGQALEEYHDDSKHLRLMREEQQQVQQRITLVETTVTQHAQRLTVVELTQIDLKNIVASLAASNEKATDLAHTLSQKAAINEMTIVAVKERTDQFADHMEKVVDSLVAKQEDTTKKVERHETKWGVLQAVALAVMGVLIAILVQHFFHF